MTGRLGELRISRLYGCVRKTTIKFSPDSWPCEYSLENVGEDTVRRTSRTLGIPTFRLGIPEGDTSEPTENFHISDEILLLVVKFGSAGLKEGSTGRYSSILGARTASQPVV